MKLFLTIILFFFSAGLFAQTTPETKAIFNDINFVANQLTLDTKAQAQVAANPAPTQSHHGHKKEKDPEVLAPVVPNAVTRAFSASTVWGDLSVKVLDFGSRMALQVKSSVPAQGWMLQKGDSNNILFKGNVENNALNFQIEIPRQYSPDLGLTVIVNSGDGQNPAFIALK